MVNSNGSSPARPPPRGPITVRIVGARGLRSLDWPKASDPCCYCEIPGKPKSRFQTKVVENSLSPSWDREQEIEDYAVGDALVFSVYDRHAEEPGQLLPLGKATLESELFHPDGFEGELRLLGEEAASEAFVRVRVERASEVLRKSGRALDCIEVLGGIALAGLAQDNLDDTGGSLVTKAPSNDMSELASGCGGIDSESPDGEERHCFSTTEAHEPYRGEIGVFEARPGEVLDRIVEAPGREDGSPERKPVDDSAKARTIPMRALFFNGPAEQIEPPAEHVSEEPLPEGEVVHVVTEVKSDKSNYGINPFGDEEEAGADGSSRASRARSMTEAVDSLGGEAPASEVKPDGEARPSMKQREFSGDYLLPRTEIGGNRKETDAGPLEPREDADAVEDAPRGSIVPGSRGSIEPGQRGSILPSTDARGSLPRDYSGDYLLPRKEIGGNRKDTDAGPLEPQTEASSLPEDAQHAGGVTALPQPGDLEPVVSATRTGDGADDAYPSSDIYPASEGAATQPGASTPDQPLSAVATVDADTPYAKESALGGPSIFDWSGAELKNSEPCGLDSLSELDLLSPKSNRQAAVAEEKADGDGEPDVIATLSETISAEAVEKGVRAAVASVSRDEDGPAAARDGKEPADPTAAAVGMVHVSEGSATTVSVAPVEEAEAVEEEEDEQPPVLLRSSTSRASGAWSSPTASPKSTRSGVAPRVLLGGAVPEEEEQGVVAQEAPSAAAPRATSEVTVAPDTPPGAVTNLLDLSPVRERPPAAAGGPAAAGEEEACPKGLGRLSRAGFAVPGEQRSPEKEAPESPLLLISPSGTASVPGASLVPGADAAATGTPKAQAASPKEARQDLTAPLLDLGDLGEVMAESRHRFNAGPLANENRSLLDITPAVSPGVKDIPEEGTITRSSSSSEVRAPTSVERPPELVLPELTREPSPKNSSAPKSPVPPVWMEGLRPPKPLLDVEPISPCTNPDPERERSSDQRMGARGLLEMEPFSPADGTKSREPRKEEPDPPVAVESVPLIMVHPPLDAAKNPDYRSPRRDGEAALPEAGRESVGSRNGPLFMSSEGADSLVPQTEEEERDSGRGKEEGGAKAAGSLGGGDASGGPENPGARGADAPAAKKASEPAEVTAVAPPAAPVAVTTEKDKMMEQMMEEFRRMKEEMSQQLQAAQRLNEEKDEQVRRLQERLSQEEEVRQTLSTQMAQQQVQLRQLEARREPPGGGSGSAFPPATSARAESERSQSPGGSGKLASSLRGLDEGGWPQKPPSRAAAMKEHAASDRKTHHQPSPPKEQPASRDEQKPLFDDSDEEDRMSVESGPKGEGCLCMSR